MPASLSRSRAVEPTQPARWRWPLVLLGFIGVLAGVVFSLPASVIAHVLPSAVHVEDLSGSVTHGAAAKLSVYARDAGAIEWRLHPLSLLRAHVVADIHWVKVGFVIDGTADIDRGGFAAHDIRGGGPIESLTDIGVAAGWRGTASLKFDELKSDFNKPLVAVGEIEVANLSSAGIAAGTDLGGYLLQLVPGSVSPDGSISATLKDTGGPLEVLAQIQISPAARTGLLSGTLKERPEASPALRNQLQSMAQIRPRDSAGRFPVDLEFTF
ncbi:MAG: type II secretion system protein N [Steroidobacteraceae bacterium]